MEWNKLLSKKRLRASQKAKTNWEFQLDFSRIFFSSAFRRLQDKTQVFPLAESDYARTRLTHSIEASCVGRALGTIVGNRTWVSPFNRLRVSGFLPCPQIPPAPLNGSSHPTQAPLRQGRIFRQRG